jgi:hypothetical protein
MRFERATFLALIVVQGAHSIEEYVFGLYEVFAPARFASGLVSNDLATGFAILNVTIVAFGIWCYAARVGPGRPSAPGWIWAWILLELGNGVVHTTMAVLRGGYFPGVATAPLLFLLALFLATRLLRARRSPGWTAT